MTALSKRDAIFAHLQALQATDATEAKKWLDDVRAEMPKRINSGIPPPLPSRFVELASYFGGPTPPVLAGDLQKTAYNEWHGALKGIEKSINQDGLRKTVANWAATQAAASSSGIGASVASSAPPPSPLAATITAAVASAASPGTPAPAPGSPTLAATIASAVASTASSRSASPSPSSSRSASPAPGIPAPGSPAPAPAPAPVVPAAALAPVIAAAVAAAPPPPALMTPFQRALAAALAAPHRPLTTYGAPAAPVPGIVREQVGVSADPGQTDKKFAAFRASLGAPQIDILKAVRARARAAAEAELTKARSTRQERSARDEAERLRELFKRYE